MKGITPSALVLSAAILSLGGVAQVPLLASSPSPTTTSLIVAPSAVSVGTVVTLTATVSSEGHPVSPGLVLFCNAAAPHCTDIHILGQAQLTKSGVATVKLRLPIGEHKIKAEFQGTYAFAASASSDESLAVTGKFVTDTSILKSGLNLVSAVTSYNRIPATGAVSFLDETSGTLCLLPFL